MKPHPFSFFKGAHKRRHGPSGWKDYQKYRPWLRDEFSYRCVFCLIREQWVDMRRGYQIDHFIPQKLRQDLKADYDNLLYLCPACNSLKSAHLLPDPSAHALEECLRFNDDGTVDSLSIEGTILIEILELDDPQLIQMRRRKIGILKSLFEHKPSLFKEEMSFPKDLPDLKSENPPTNTRPEGIEDCCFEKHNRGELPDTY